MKDIDAFRIQHNAVYRTDVCIVGAGAAGICVAHQLAAASNDVMLMESGDLQPDAATQSLTEFESVGLPHRPENEHGLPARLRCLGGTTNIWGGRCATLHEIDFKPREWIEDSGWPISFEELRPHYTQASKLFRLPRMPQPRTSETERQLLQTGVVEPVDFSFANRPVNMKTEYPDRLRRSRNIQIVLNANAAEIEPHPDQRSIHRIHFRTLAGNTFFVEARIFVLACGGWENARLMLLSRRYSGAGLANQHDVVGRYLMDHPIVRHGIIRQDSHFIRSPEFLCPTKVPGGYIKRGFRLTDHVQAEQRLPNHYVDLVPLYDEPLHDLPYARKGFYNLAFPDLQTLSSGCYLQQIGRGIQFLAAQYLGRPLRSDRLGIISHLEQTPHRESRLTLSRTKDRLGLNQLCVDLQVSRTDKESLRRFHEILSETLAREASAVVESDLPDVESRWDIMTDAFHHMGATRMGYDPKTSVVDRHCRVHGIDNLFISGSSVFPTGGCTNPTLTIGALALRLASHVLSEATRLSTTKNLRFRTAGSMHGPEPAAGK